MNREIDRILEYKKIAIKYDLPLFSELRRNGYFTAPASSKYHGAYDGGLFDHSFEVMKWLLYYTEKLGLKWDNERSPYVIGLFHDICKCGLYKPSYDGIGYDYEDIIIPGHGDRSVIILQKYINLTNEEIACIRWHMGPYETDKRLWNNYSMALKVFPNILYTHTADVYASQIVGL